MMCLERTQAFASVRRPLRPESPRVFLKVCLAAMGGSLVLSWIPVNADVILLLNNSASF